MEEEVERDEELQANSEEHGEDVSTEEAETEAESEGGEQQSATKPATKPAETSEQRTARLKRQVEREAKKQGISVEDYLGIKKESHASPEEIQRLELKTEGVKSKKEQDVVLNYIREKKLLGHTVDVETALTSLVVKEELANIRKSDNTPKPSTRPNQVGGEKTLEQYAEMMKKGRTREVPLAKQREIRKQRLIKW